MEKTKSVVSGKRHSVRYIIETRGSVARGVDVQHTCSDNTSQRMPTTTRHALVSRER